MARTKELLEGRSTAAPATFNRLHLRTWRRERWLTQAMLGQLLGVKAQTVYRWESGESDVPTFLKLALDQLDTLHLWSPDGVDALPRIGAHAS